jgi:nitric oxide reductase NorE protein
MAHDDSIVSGRSNVRVPGEIGIWIFILFDLFFEFSIIFGYFVYDRAAAPDLFAQGRATLSRNLGLINTIILLTSSMFVALGVHALREGDRNGATRSLARGHLLGLMFVAVKIIEYTMKFRVGITPVTNDFYMFYFVATGLHLFHVLIGLLMLRYAINCTRELEARPGEMRSTEVAANFWHMVDLVWIVLFPLLYLVA